MSVTSLEAWRFRNFSHFHILPDSQLNIIYGKNGSGKTSLIEAVFSLGRLRSFRTSNPRQLISTGQEDCLCVARILDTQDHLHQLGIQRSRNTQLVKLDGELLKRSSDLANLLPLQIINNDIHLLIEGSPNTRRQFLDWGVFHLESTYGATLKQYRHILKQRNAALKKHWGKNDIALWDKQLISTGQRIHEMRQRYLDSLNHIWSSLLQDSFNLPPVSFQYFPGWDRQRDFASVLAESLESDIRLGKTHHGPHRADLRFRSNGQPLKEVVSRGQQKIIATLLLLAQVDFFTQDSEHNLLLLIDDLPAELDRDFREYFLKKVLATRSQLFITAIDQESIDLSETSVSGKMFHVEHGHVTEV